MRKIKNQYESTRTHKKVDFKTIKNTPENLKERLRRFKRSRSFEKNHPPSLLKDLDEDIATVFTKIHQKLYRSFSIFSYRFFNKFKNKKTSEVVLQRPRSSGKGPTKKQLRLQDRVLNIDNFVVSQFKKFLISKVENKNYKGIDDNMMKVFWDLKRGEELERKIELDNQSMEMNRQLLRLKKKGVDLDRKRLSQQGEQLKTDFRMRMSVYAGVKMFRLSVLEPKNLLKEDDNVKRALARMRIATKFLFHGKRGTFAHSKTKESSENIDIVDAKSQNRKMKRVGSMAKRGMKRKRSHKREDLRCYMNYSTRMLNKKHKFKSLARSSLSKDNLHQSSKFSKVSKKSQYSLEKSMIFPKLTKSTIFQRTTAKKNPAHKLKSKYSKSMKFSPYDIKTFVERESNTKKNSKNKKIFKLKTIKKFRRRRQMSQI